MADPRHHHDHDHDHDHDPAHDHDHDAAPAHGHHGHDHDHDVLHGQIGAELNIDELDPANRSLAEALRVSFGALKLLMVLLVAAYVFSGWFTVKEGEVAIRLHLGSVAGSTASAVYEPGGPYFAWPVPIDQVITVPTGVQQVVIDQAFWFTIDPSERGKRIEELMVYNTRLMPGVEGSLITADKNIVHSQWSLNFRVNRADAAQFVRNVGFARGGDYSDRAGEANYEPEYFKTPLNRRPMHRAEKILRWAAEEAIVHAVAQTTADDFVRANIDRDRVRGAIQRRLDELKTGLTVTQVHLQFPTPPLAVREAFAAVSQAESERARKLEDARREAAQTLINTAGSAYEDLLGAIEAYEQARDRGDAAAVSAADGRITALLDPERVGGEVSSMISEAVSYRRGLQQTVEAEREQFQRLLPGYRENPGIVLGRLWQDTLQAVLSGDVETIYLPSDDEKTLQLEVNRDPAVRKRRDAERYRQQLDRERNADAK